MKFGCVPKLYISNVKFQALREQKKVNAGAQFSIKLNAQEEGIQIALEILGKIKAYEKQRISGIHLMPVGWDEIIPRIVTEAGLAPRQLLLDNTSQEWNHAYHIEK